MSESLSFVLKTKKIRRMLECYVLIFLCFFLFGKKGSYVFYGIVLVSYLLSLYFLCSFLYQMAPLAKKEMQEVILQEQMKLQEEHLKILKNNHARIQELRCSASEELLKMNNGNLEEIDKNKIHAFVENMQLTEVNYCENKVIDALLHNKITLAKSKQIQVYTQVIAPENLNIKLLDLISLFSNLLDNAIDASKKSENPFIMIDCYPNRNYFVIKVSNSKIKEEKVNLLNSISTKNDAKHHGLGMYIIKNIVEKYDGDIQICYDDFTADIEIIIRNG